VVKVLARTRLARERQQASVLSERTLLREVQHPFIVQLHGTFKTANYLGLALEPLLGGDLFNHLTTRPSGVISCDDARFYSACILTALGELHSRHILYRDLKPENVMLTHDGYVKLVDFGYAKRLTERTFSVVGTVEYLAPEVIQQRGHSFGADWWALGVLIYEMVCGCTPFTDCGSEKNEMVVCKNITSDAFRFDYRPGITAECRAAIDQLLTRQPLDRLGCGGGSSRDVRAHSFFRGVDYDALVSQALAPPFIPALDSECDTSNFDDMGMDGAISTADDAEYEPSPSSWDFFF